MKNVEVSFVDLKVITTGLKSFATNHLTNIYSFDQMVYVWVISNSELLMKKVLYSNIVTFADRGKCAWLQFQEGYHVGGNLSTMQNKRCYN